MSNYLWFFWTVAMFCPKCLSPIVKATQKELVHCLGVWFMSSFWIRHLWIFRLDSDNFPREIIMCYKLQFHLVVYSVFVYNCVCLCTITGWGRKCVQFKLCRLFTEQVYREMDILNKEFAYVHIYVSIHEYVCIVYMYTGKGKSRLVVVWETMW